MTERERERKCPKHLFSDIMMSSVERDIAHQNESLVYVENDFSSTSAPALRDVCVFFSWAVMLKSKSTACLTFIRQQLFSFQVNDNVVDAARR